MLIKYSIPVLLFLTFEFTRVQSQQLPAWSRAELAVDSLSRNVLTNQQEAQRQHSVDSIMATFDTYFGEAASFKLPFTNTRSMSIQYPADSSFRIITGQHFVNDSTYRYYGGIQLASGAFIVLSDNSRELRNDHRDLDVLDANDWYGALYYRIFDCMINDEKYYLLLGFNAFTFYDKQKIIDVLSFGEDQQPIFGKNVFIADTGEVQDVSVRKIYTFSADASFKLNYDPELGFIVLDHLMPISSPYPGQTLINVPDGSLEGYKYQGGLWQHINVLDQLPLENIEVVPILGNEKGKDILGKEKKK